MSAYKLIAESILANAAETLLKGSEPPQPRPAGRPNFSTIEAACDTFLDDQAALANLKSAKAPNPADVERLVVVLADSRREVRAYLKMKRGCRFAYRARLWSVDKAGVVHVSPLPAGKVSPVGARFGALLATGKGKGK